MTFDMVMILIWWPYDSFDFLLYDYISHTNNWIVQLDFQFGTKGLFTYYVSQK